MLKRTKKVKKGAASIYVVILVTLILGVITVSFSRIIISEIRKANSNDLSQSAYDSAKTGIEDARTAIANCIKEHGSVSKCNIVSERCNDFMGGPYLTRDLDADGSVKIQTTSSGNSKLNQSYTCVTLENELEDYRSTISASAPVQMIPLKTSGDKIKDLSKIKISWHQKDASNEVLRNENCSSTDTCYFSDKNGATVPPVLAVSLLQAGTNGFNLEDLANKYTKSGSSVGVGFGTIVLYPTALSGATKDLGKDKWEIAANPNEPNKPVAVKCDGQDSEFMCNVTIGVPNVKQGQTRNNDATFLLLSLPYNNGEVEFKVEMLGAGSNVLEFQDAQIKIDSTGRANDSYRRIEARVNTSNLYFPYPMYGIDTGDGIVSNDIKKNYYVTRNCWKTIDGDLSSAVSGEGGGGIIDNKVKLEACDNSGEL